ncbi:RHS repeat-associated core domain-containing protein [Rubripirellula lacrimiformis]|nr:RHS repeat-associated core domain-containing protein [Rubripirellula lacrimiformis]
MFQWKRFHRSRDFFRSGNLGQGVLSSFDMRLFLEYDGESAYDVETHSDGMGGYNVNDNFSSYIEIPESSIKLGLGTYSGNVWYPENRNRAEKLEIFDDQMQPVSAVVISYSPMDYPSFPGAKYAKLTTWDGGTFLFELTMAHADSNWDATDNHPTDGRLIEAKDRYGIGYDITYKTWTPAQITASPSRQWQIDNVTDTNGRTISFTYDTVQHAGLWVVEKVTLPNSDEIEYRYLNGFLNEIEYPDGTISTITFSDSANGMFKMSFSEKAAEPGHRNKTVLFAGMASVYQGDVIPSTFGVVRMVSNGEDEPTYYSFTTPQGPHDPTTSTSGHHAGSWVYEGGGRLFAEVELSSANSLNYLTPRRHLKDGWLANLDELGNPMTTLSASQLFAGTFETHFEQFAAGTHADVFRGKARRTIDAQGHEVIHAFSSGSRSTGQAVDNRLRSDYADNSFETYCYNSRNQVTRYRDRAGHVTHTDYDSSGRVTSYEVGLEDSSSNVETSDPYTGTSTYDRCATDDVQTTEHATYQWTYYSSGTSVGLVETYTDARGNVTDYEYDAKRRLYKVIAPPEASGGTRAELVYTYDSQGRVEKITNPIGDDIQYVYDDRNRIISTIYDDGTTERVIYGTGNDLALMLKTIDRNGVVTTYDYDSADRMVTRVTAAAQMTGGIETATPDLAATETFAYLNGTFDVIERNARGSKSYTVYDYRGRPVEKTRSPRDGKTLETVRVYVNNQLFKSEDPFGRNTYFAYDATDGRLIRTVAGTVPGFSLTNASAVISLLRDTSANADYVVSDTIYDSEGNIERRHDGRNMATAYEHDSRDRQVASVADANYTDRGTLSSLPTALSLRTETDYDLASNVTEVRSPRYFDSGDSEGYQKAKETWTYNGRGLIATHTEAPGTAEAATESFAYDLLGRRIERTDFAGKVWKTHYEDCCGQVMASENPLGHGSIVRKDAVGRTIHQVSTEDYTSHVASLDNPVDAKTLREMTTKYDGRGRPIARTTWLVARGTVDATDPPIAGLGGVSAADGLTEQFLYDDDLTDDVGLDSSGGMSLLIGSDPVSLSAALTKLADTEANGGAGVTFDADATGSARVTINPEGEVRYAISDAAGRSVMSGVLKASDSSLITWNCSVHDATTTVSGFGTVLVSKSVNALGKVNQQYTDAAGRTIQSLDALGKITSYEFDAAGNQLKVRDPNGVGQDCTYDALGRDLTCTDTSSAVVSSSYDTAGNKIAATDAKSETTTYAFDARGRQVMQTDRLGGETEFAYSATGQLLSLTDAQDQVTSYTYNDAGTKLTETYPDHVPSSTPGQTGYGIVSFTPDATGRTEVRMDQQGDTCTYAYDLAGRLLDKVYAANASGPLSGQGHTDTFTYDDAGRTLTAVSGRYTNTVTYTYDDAGRKATEALTMGGQTYTTATDYDAVGQVSGYTYPDGTAVARTYSDRGQLATIAYASTTVDTRSYDDGGRMTGSAYNNGVSAIRAYNTDNTLASITHSGAAVGNYTYGWDSNKNKTSEAITGTLSGYGFDVGSSGYDDEDRLVNWERDDSSLDQSWNLSLVGDWNSFTENASSQARTHGPTHEMLTVAGQAVTHDTKGNTTSIPAVLRAGSDPLAMKWDFENKLIGADIDNDATDDVTYQWDALLRRVGRDDGTTASIYVQNGQQTVADYTSGTAATSPTYTYIYASYVDEPVVRAGGSGLRYYHRNQQYSIIALTNASGTVMERYAYSAYGTPTIMDASGTVLAASAENNRYLYTGREYDEVLDLYHYRARMYDSASGRFCSRDPIGYEGSPWNVYEYVGGRSTNDVDPSGLVRLANCQAIFILCARAAQAAHKACMRTRKASIQCGIEKALFIGICSAAKQTCWAVNAGRVGRGCVIIMIVPPDMDPDNPLPPGVT